MTATPRLQLPAPSTDIYTRAHYNFAKEIGGDIVRTILDYFGAQPDEIFTRYKGGKVVRIRQITQYMLRRHTSLTLSQIGLITGAKDHATVIHSCNTIDNLTQPMQWNGKLIIVDRAVKRFVDELDKLITGDANAITTI